MAEGSNQVDPDIFAVLISSMNMRPTKITV